MILKHLTFILIFCLIVSGCVLDRTFYDFYEIYPVPIKQGTLDFNIQGSWKSSTIYGSPYTLNLIYNSEIKNSVIFVKNVKVVATGHGDNKIISELMGLKIVANTPKSILINNTDYVGSVRLGSFKLEHIEHKLLITINHSDSNITESVELILKPFIRKGSFSLREEVVDWF